MLAVALVATTASTQSDDEPSYRIEGSFTAGSIMSTSENFSLTGCIDSTGIVGSASSSSFSLLTGCGSYFLTSTNDDDGDSVPNDEEDLIGDGNGDGIADRLQSHVASVFSGGVAATAEVTSGTCTRFSLASAEAAELLPPHPRFAFPQGMVRISLACSQSGGDATVRILFPGAEQSVWPPFDYRSYGVSALDQTARYRSLSLSDSGRATIGERSIPYVSLELSDGLLGDSSPTDGSIELMSGPADTSHPVRR